MRSTVFNPAAARLSRAAREGWPKKRASKRRSEPGESAKHFPRNMKRPPEGPLHSPSRFRFRPPNPLTFGFRLRPSSGASTYLRPVLGAIGTLGPRESRCKVPQWEQRAFCELFFFQHFPSISSNLWKSLVCSGVLSTPAANGGLSEAEQAAFPPRLLAGFFHNILERCGKLAPVAQAPERREQRIGDTFDEAREEVDHRAGDP